jgi:hypothetical protein
MSGWIGSWGVSATVADLTVTNSQVISVNTSTNALRITQTGSGNALLVEDSANPDNSPFVIDANGRAGIGGTSTGGSYGNVANQMPLTGSVNTSAYGAIVTIQSDVTSFASIYKSQPTTTATAFTLTSLAHFSAEQYGFGAGSTVTRQYGFFADSSLTNATNNYGFYSNIASGTGRWNFYAANTADNYFAGNTYTASGTTTMTSGFFHIPAAAGAPTGVPTAVAGRVPMYYDTTNNNFYVYNGAWKKVLLA